MWFGTDWWNHMTWRPCYPVDLEPEDSDINGWLKSNPVTEKNKIDLRRSDIGIPINNVCKIDYNPMRDEYVVSFVSGSGVSLDSRELDTKLEVCLNRQTVSDIFINGKKSNWKNLYEILNLKNACNVIRNFKASTSSNHSIIVSLEIDPQVTLAGLVRPPVDYTSKSKILDSARKEKGKMGNRNYRNYAIKSYFEIKNIIFNDPATIVIWDDGTKTVVKCQEGDSFDPEKGVAMAVMKRALGSNETGSNYLKPVKKYFDEYYEREKRVNDLALETLKTVLHGALHGSFKSDGEVETEERNENTDIP